MCPKFQAKQTTLPFSTHIRPETAFLLEIQKTNVRIRISILEILGVPIFNQNEQVCFFFWPKFAEK